MRVSLLILAVVPALTSAWHVVFFQHEGYSGKTLSEKTGKKSISCVNMPAPKDGLSRNRASSIRWANPANNCKLSAYGVKGCDGDQLLTVFEGKTDDYPLFNDWLNDKILSYKVHCI